MTFSALRLFFSKWNPIQQLTAYAILGGIPSYWEQFNASHIIEKNIRERILRSSSRLYLEPMFLVYEELHEPRNYLGILWAIAQGNREMRIERIWNRAIQTKLGKQSSNSYPAM